MGATIEDDADSFGEESDDDELELPRLVNVTFYNNHNSLIKETQGDTRQTTTSDTQVDVGIPISCTPTYAKQLAAKLNDIAWLERRKFKVRLPPKYAMLIPGDVVTITLDGIEADIRLLTVELGLFGELRCEAVRNSDVAMAQTTDGGEGEFDYVDTPLEAVPTDFIAWSGKELKTEDQYYPGIYVACSGPSGWRGCTVYYSTDGGTTWVSGGFTVEKAVFGEAATALADGAVADAFDDVNDVDVLLERDEIESKSDAEILLGMNRAVLGSEIVGFGVATLNAPQDYTLSHIQRGLRGSPMTGHTIGERFVQVSNGGVVRLNLSEDLVGEIVQVKAVSPYQVLADVTGINVTVQARTPLEIEADIDAVETTLTDLDRQLLGITVSTMGGNLTLTREAATGRYLLHPNLVSRDVTLWDDPELGDTIYIANTDDGTDELIGITVKDFDTNIVALLARGQGAVLVWDGTVWMAQSKNLELTSSRVMVTDAQGLTRASIISTTVLEFLFGVHTPIQEQLDAKADGFMPQDVTYAASVDLDVSVGNLFRMTLPGDIEVNVLPLSETDGQRIALWFQNTGGGVREITWGAEFNLNGYTITPGDADGDVDIVEFQYSEMTGEWHLCGKGDIEAGPVLFQAHGNCGAAETFDLTDYQKHTGTLDANCTITLTGAVNGEYHEWQIALTQDATGGRTLTWPAEVANGTYLQPIPSPSVVTWFRLWSTDGGTTIYGERMNQPPQIVTEYTVAGNYTIQNLLALGYTEIDVWLSGGGGGGGGGRKGAAGTVRNGGGGGSSGAVAYGKFKLSTLPSSFNLTIGAGGTGGLGRSTNSTDGGSASGSGPSYLGPSTTGAYLYAGAGSSGAGGTAGTGVGGTAPSGMFPGVQGGSGAASGAAGNGTSGTITGAGGGSGGGVTSGNVAGIGGTGGQVTSGQRTTTTAGAVDGNGNPGLSALGTVGGTGGSGGGGSTSTNGGAGGNGGYPGGGGGGGGGATDAVGNSGAGGNGGGGYGLIVIT
jgi:hypothetical protein